MITIRYGFGYDGAWGIAVDSQDDVIVTGQVWNGVDYDYFTIKYIGLKPPLLDIINLITDKPSYTPSESVTTTATVINNFDSTVTDVFVDFVTKDPSGATINTDTQKIRRLRAGQSKNAVTTYTLGSNSPPGTYTVVASVRWNSQTYDTGQATFQVTPAPPSDVTMHVEAIDFSTSQGGKTEKLFITVTVLDENLNPVSGATVSGELTLPDSTMKTYSGDTGADGKVTFEHSQKNQPLPTGTFTFTVTDVVKSGAAYDSAQNKETSDSFTIGGGPTNVVMHVEAIDFTTQQTKKSEKLLITVTIFDEDLNPVSGATVSGDLTLPDSSTNTYSGDTETDGSVTFEYSVKNQQLPTGTYTFTVTEVVKSGSTYDSAQNVETSDSFTK
jgi:protocatechuate 3,4-dioxygenase beta subunit